MKPKSVLLTVKLVSGDVLLVPTGRGSWVTASYQQYRRAGLKPMRAGQQRTIRIEIHDEEKKGAVE